MRRCFHPQLPPPPRVLSQKEEGSPPPPLLGLFEVEALPRKWGGRGSLGWATSGSMALMSQQAHISPENHYVRHFQIHSQ